MKGSSEPMLTVGVDIVELSRIKAVYERWGQRFLDRIYTRRSRPTAVDAFPNWRPVSPPRRQ